MKSCSKCGIEKPLDAFYAEKKSPDGRRGDCKDCILRLRKERYATDAEMRARILARNKVGKPATKPRSCRLCGVDMMPSIGGKPGICVACKRALGYKVRVTREQRLAIYERDGWVCQICHRDVEPTLHPNHTFAATLDHIAPRSLTLFPDDSPENLRLAHRACNSARGVRAA